MGKEFSLFFNGGKKQNFSSQPFLKIQYSKNCLLLCLNSSGSSLWLFPTDHS